MGGDIPGGKKDNEKLIPEGAHYHLPGEDVLGSDLGGGGGGLCDPRKGG